MTLYLRLGVVSRNQRANFVASTHHGGGGNRLDGCCHNMINKNRLYLFDDMRVCGEIGDDRHPGSRAPVVGNKELRGIDGCALFIKIS
jgi:hypothetical protein